MIRTFLLASLFLQCSCTTTGPNLETAAPEVATSIAQISVALAPEFHVRHMASSDFLAESLAGGAGIPAVIDRQTMLRLSASERDLFARNVEKAALNFEAMVREAAKEELLQRLKRRHPAATSVAFEVLDIIFIQRLFGRKYRPVAVVALRVYDAQGRKLREAIGRCTAWSMSTEGLLLDQLLLDSEKLAEQITSSLRVAVMDSLRP